MTITVEALCRVLTWRQRDWVASLVHRVWPESGMRETDTLTIARWLVHERGVGVIPLDHPAETTQTDSKRIGKVPALSSWKLFQEVRPTDDNLESWFGNGRRRNIAIVTGAVSRIVAIDCDSPEAIAWADAHLPPTPMITRTAKGEHRFYKHPGGAIRNKARVRTGDERIAIDIRADGGYVVAPGSVHQSGTVYARAGPWPLIDALPVFDPAWLKPETPDPPVGESRQVRRARGRAHHQDREQLRRRARKYLDATPAAVEGERGDEHTFQLCCRLVRGFDFSDSDVIDLLADWNARCLPPWSDDELRAKVEGARKYGDEPIGGWIDDRRHIRSSQDASSSRPDRTPGIPLAGLDRPDPSEAPSTFNLTDSGNAEYFAARHGRNVRYDHRRGRYLLWRRHRFEPDSNAEIRRLAKAAMRQRFVDATAIDDSHERSRLAKWAIGSESRSRLDALLYLAQAEDVITDAGDAFDAGRDVLGVLNGVVELRTGTLRPGRREDRITLQASVEYHPDAQSPLWDYALRTILLDDELIQFFHVAIGYSATGDTRRDCWFLGCGNGRNGKGTLFQPIRHALGDYALELPGAIFDLRTGRSPYELAKLPGRRFVTSAESGDTLRLHHDRIKQLTGGDSMSAANKYEQAFEFEPVCKLWLACNKRPRVTDDTSAFWARVFLIPFRASFVGKEDRSLRPALVQEAVHQAAVLAWIVRGAVRYYAEGLDEVPAVVRTATAEYREDCDPLAVFLDESCALDPEAEVGAKDLYEHYTRWADGQHFTVKERLSATMFGRLVGGRFDSRKDRTTGVKNYLGLARRGVF